MYFKRDLIIKRIGADGKILNIILFGDTSDPKIKCDSESNDPYNFEDVSEATETNGKSSSFIFSAKKSGKIKYYNPKLKLNRCDLNCWTFYTIRNLKYLLAIFIGVPVSHIDLRIPNGKSVGHKILEDGTIIITDIIKKVFEYPLELDLYLWGDHINNINKEHLEYNYPEIQNLNEDIVLMPAVNRQEFISEYLSKEKLISELSKLDIKKGLEGKYMLTGFSTEIDENNFGLYSRKIFDLLDISEEIIFAAYNDGDTIITKNNISTKIEMTELTTPTMQGQLIYLLFLDKYPNKKFETYFPRTFIIKLNPGGSIEIVTIWTDIENVTNEGTRAITKEIIGYFQGILDKLNIKEITYPLSNVEKKSDNIIRTNSIYYETFSHGQLKKLQNIVSQLSQIKLIKQTFSGEAKIAFKLPMFSSYDRVNTIDRYVKKRIEGKNRYQIYEKYDTENEVYNISLEGPEINLISDSSKTELRCEILNVADENEMVFARDTIRRITKFAEYTHVSKSEITESGYMSLSILQNTDPILFGTRLDETTGERYNYSRVFQTTARHPIVVSKSVAENKDQNRVLYLKNTTYGGITCYYCSDDEYQFPVFRRAGLGQYCFVGCIKSQITPESLKGPEYYACAKDLYYDEKLLQEFKKQLVYIKYDVPIVFTNNIIPKGRLCKLPNGVREYFSTNCFIHYPDEVDIPTLKEILQFALKRKINFEINTDLSIAYNKLMNESINILVIKLKELSKNIWTGHFIFPKIVGYKVPKDAILIFKIEDNFYLSADEKFNPVVVSDDMVNYLNKLSENKEDNILDIFDYHNIMPILEDLKYKVSGGLYVETKLYSLCVKKGDSEFVVPINPIRIPITDYINGKDYTKYLPTLEEITKFIKDISKDQEITNNISEIIFDGKKHYGFKLENINLIFFYKPTTDNFKSPFDKESIGNAKKVEIPFEYISFISDNPPSAILEETENFDSMKKIKIVSILSANIIIRKNLISEKDLQLKADELIEQLFSRIVKGNYIDIGTKEDYKIYDNNIVLVNKKYVTTAKVLRRSLLYLITNAPKTKEIFIPYLSSIGTYLDESKYVVKENILLNKYPIL